MCRGCCCGTEDPGAPARLAHLQDVVRRLEGGRFKRTDCLGPCEQRDVVVVKHRSLVPGGPPLPTTWLGGVSDELLDVLSNWLSVGAPVPVPLALQDIQLDPRTFETTEECEVALKQVAKARKR